MQKSICLSIIGLFLFCSLGFAELLDNGVGTVTDTDTGLMWQQTDAGTMRWEEALTYCETLELAGHNDWRLPNINELQSIVDYSAFDPCIDMIIFPAGVTSDSYWSSTTNAIDTTWAWAADFSYGYTLSYDKMWFWSVRAVRGGQ